jgi:hypothetical protein
MHHTFFLSTFVILISKSIIARSVSKENYKHTNTMKDIDYNYLPKDENGLLEWLKNFSSHLPTIGIMLGITPSEISSLNKLIASVKNDLRNGTAKEVDKIEKKNNVLKFVYKYVDRITGHSKYNSEHGKKLGIIN